MLNVGMPDQSDDGAVVFVSGQTGCGDIYESRSENEPIQLTSEEVFEGDLCLSLSGEDVYFTKESKEGAAIWRVNRRTHLQTKITPAITAGHQTVVAELNGGNSLLVMRTSRSGTNFIEMKISSAQELRSFGELAVASLDGKFVFYVVANNLRLLDVASGHENSLPANWIAWPLAISKSGKFAVVRRYTEPWQFDGELYWLDMQKGSFLQFGLGHSAVIDEQSKVVTFASGYRGELSLFDQDKGTTTSLPLPPAYRTNLREVSDGVVFASIVDGKGLSYEVTKFNFNSHTIAKIAETGQK